MPRGQEPLRPLPQRLFELQDPPRDRRLRPCEDPGGLAKPAESGDLDEGFELAQGQPGFLGIETALIGGFSMAVSYWDSLESIET